MRHLELLIVVAKRRIYLVNIYVILLRRISASAAPSGLVVLPRTILTPTPLKSETTVSLTILPIYIVPTMHVPNFCGDRSFPPSLLSLGSSSGSPPLRSFLSRTPDSIIHQLGSHSISTSRHHPQKFPSSASRSTSAPSSDGGSLSADPPC